MKESILFDDLSCLLPSPTVLCRLCNISTTNSSSLKYKPHQSNPKMTGNFNCQYASRN